MAIYNDGLLYFNGRGGIGNLEYCVPYFKQAMVAGHGYNTIMLDLYTLLG